MRVRNVHFNSRKSYVTGNVMLKQRSGPGCCVFKTCKIYMFDTPVLSQFLLDFVLFCTGLKFSKELKKCHRTELDGNIEIKLQEMVH